jgi:hypothetical protein
MLSSYEDWLKEYRKDKYKIWVRVVLSNGEEKYFCEYKDWYKIKNYCKKALLDVAEIGLQYRSNHLAVETKDCDGVYLVQSIIGLMGENSKKTYTVGKIYGDTVKKQVFMTPELIQDREEKDPLASCFEEGLLYHHEKGKTKAI